jgi:alkylated DNA nucleotide flippase Atl1
MTSMDFARARAFIEAIPAGRWAAYKDVATAAGNERGAQAVRLTAEGVAIDDLARAAPHQRFSAIDWSGTG